MVTGKKSDLDFAVSYNAEKAIADMAKQIAKQDAIIGKVKSQNKVTKDAMRQMTKAYKKAGTEAGRTKDQVGGIGDAAGGAAKKVGQFMAGFATIASVSVAMRSVLDMMKEAGQLRTGMFDTAVEYEKMIQKTADLSGGKPSDYANTESKAKQLAMSGHVTPEFAAEALFTAESSLGANSEKAFAAAKNMVAFGGAPGLTPGEIKAMPKIFAAVGADTHEEQAQVTNQVAVATALSSSETGAYIGPSVKLVNVLKARGYELSEMLARMTSMVEVSGSEAEAATNAMRFDEITSGLISEKAMKAYIAHAKKRGIDFKELANPERAMYFTDEFYPSYVSTGRTDELGRLLGPEASRVAQMAAGERAVAKYKESLPKIAAAKDSTYVLDKAEHYAGTKIAASIDQANRQFFGEVGTGTRYQAVALFNKEVDAIQKQAKANIETNADRWWFFSRPEMLGMDMERHGIGKEFLRQQLMATMPVYGSKEANAGEEGLGPEEMQRRMEAVELLNKLSPKVNMDSHPNLIKQVYDITGGFPKIETLRPWYDMDFSPITLAPLRGMIAHYSLDFENQQQRWEASGDVAMLRSKGAPEQDVVAAINRLESMLGQVLQANKNTSAAVEQNTQAVYSTAEQGGGAETGEGGLD